MDEEALLKKINGLFRQRPDVALGPGDDCAAIRIPGYDSLLLLAADQVVGGIHFLHGESPERVGAKLLKRNVSDIAAMGGRPMHALITAALNPLSSDWLDGFHRGIQKECETYGMCVVGGDVSSLPRPGKVLTLSIVGEVAENRMKRRDQARPGDFLYATGTFGNSFESGWHLDFVPRLPEGLFLSGYTCVHSMMDVSDGLLKDALRMAFASSCSLSLDYDALPLRSGASVEGALCDGEDYELIFSAAAESASELEAKWNFSTPLTRIGRFGGNGFGSWENPLPLKKKGFDHFHGNV